jgi:hypothetical protein
VLALNQQKAAPRLEPADSIGRVVLVDQTALSGLNVNQVNVEIAWVTAVRTVGRGPTIAMPASELVDGLGRCGERSRFRLRAIDQVELGALVATVIQTDNDPIWPWRREGVLDAVGPHGEWLRPSRRPIQKLTHQAWNAAFRTQEVQLSAGCVDRGAKGTSNVEKAIEWDVQEATRLAETG